MSLKLVDLNKDSVRNLMLEEFEQDVKEDKLFISNLLNPGSRDKYIYLFSEAILKGDDSSLARTILINGLLNDKISQRDYTGKVKIMKTPKDAHITLAEEEFNRFYMRGVCKAAASQGKSVKVYMHDKPEFKQITLDPVRVLGDLRKHIEIYKALKVPYGSDGASLQIND
jgi:hypothetical protein